MKALRLRAKGMLLTDIAPRCKVSVQAVSLLFKSLAYREKVHVFRIPIPWRGSVTDVLAHDSQRPEKGPKKKLKRVRGDDAV